MISFEFYHWLAPDSISGASVDIEQAAVKSLVKVQLLGNEKVDPDPAWN